MKKIWIALAALLFVVGTPLFVVWAPAASAATIHSIDIVAEVQSDGSAIITDTRTFEAHEGTEHYISIENLGESDIRDFSVVLDGQHLTDVGEWDVNRSRQDKAGQSGVVRLDDGYELAFGFGEYGTHTAVMTYRITNFVYTLEDGAQTVYWEFIPRNMTYTNSVDISLTNTDGFRYTKENSRLWGFGYHGRTNITPDAMTMTSDSAIDTDNYMTMLAIFPGAPFTSSVALPHTSDSLEDMAKEGSIWDGDEGADSDPGFWQETDESTGSSIAGAIGFVVGSVGALMGIVAAVSSKKKNEDARRRGLYRTSEPPTIGRENYWRDIPFDGPIVNIFKIHGEALPDLATALLLQWIREGALREVTHEAGWIFKRDESAFALVHAPVLRTKVEADYWGFIVQAARKDGVLQRKEIEQFTRKNTQLVADWQTAANEYSEGFLLANGLMCETKTKVLGIFPRIDRRLTTSGMALKNRIEGLKNYLRDFSLLNERGASNVMLWDSYMIWAGYLGIAEEVAKQFNVVDPYYTNNTYLSDSAVITGYYFSTSMRRSYTSATSSASGGGGFSSLGGGGGSFGGGGGGGGIR